MKQLVAITRFVKCGWEIQKIRTYIKKLVSIAIFVTFGYKIHACTHARTHTAIVITKHPSLSLCSSLNMRNQISQPYKTTGKIIVQYVHNLCISSHPPQKKTVSKNNKFVGSVTHGKIGIGYSCHSNVRARHISAKIPGHISRLALNRFHVPECRFDNCAG
jgi:hypothetical protein